MASGTLGRYVHPMPQGTVIAVAIVSSVAAFAVFFLLGRITRRKAPTVSTTTDSLTHHVEDQVIRMVGGRLHIDDEALAATLREAPDPTIVEKVTKDVRRIELVFEKRHERGTSKYDLGVEVHFEDGRLDRRIEPVDDAWVPDDVAAAFAKTGAARVHRPWSMPWDRAV